MAAGKKKNGKREKAQLERTVEVVMAGTRGAGAACL